MLSIIPTPLGNLEDITLRALETLKKIDWLACEDTRRTLVLLRHFKIEKTLRSYHAHSSHHREDFILEALRQGQHIGLVSDAGTPGLSDPGVSLIQQALAEGIKVESLPGPCAAITALVGSGLPTDHFFFIGFLPRRPSRAERLLRHAASLESTIVVYESPYRVRKTLEQVIKIWGEACQVVIAREVTKFFEEWIRGTASQVLTQLGERELKGEVVILLKPSTTDEEKPENDD